ncbi:protein of unknown function [Vibrio tapetis subsp. tapetis]|uniref:Uncharacterized protein n=1 Tax=Vibrio tapetis subsp. tapetis TaxID=1671868 RepID=A0A2N8ZDC1_9VIBR|nr:protein of unknown function [Vibrio tapetis subsp. tapetis]
MALMVDINESKADTSIGLEHGRDYRFRHFTKVDVSRTC